MSAAEAPNLPVVDGRLLAGAEFERQLSQRQRRGRLWARFFSLSTVVAVIALITLLLSIVNDSFGYVISRYAVDPTTLAPNGDLESLPPDALAALLPERRLGAYIRDNLSAVPPEQFPRVPLSQAMPGANLPPGAAEKTFPETTVEERREILANNLNIDQLAALVELDVVSEDVRKSFTLIESLFDFDRIKAVYEQDFGGAAATDTVLYFRNWLSWDFITAPQSSSAEVAGIRTAIFGTLWIMIITVIFSFIIGVGAAIYLEEYATGDNAFERFIETNIRNLAGVPSIIYGLLGLAVFVRAIEGITQGRTILSAALTMGLLVLPVIIINAQEALRAVPSSLREASFGLGATRWQTILRTVLPSAMPGILTGTILAMSRAIGETAPLIVIGASTTIFVDPNGPFSKFTALPIQIYQWTARPQDEFRSIAASGIIVLLVLLIGLNATAIVLRQRIRRRLHL
jgi:phosphate transport system permease protein